MKSTRTLKVRPPDPSRLMATAFIAWASTFGHASANPAGGSVAVGQATISQPSATNTIITQLSSKALINWSSFSIPGGSSVTVHQPGASSILVDRVTGGSRSLLFGTLTANGQVWLINGAGIVVGPGANITAAGVLLSTAGIADGDFSAGSYNFGVAGSPGAAVVNRGAITATDGSAVLAGERVKNRGVVAARLGTVALVGAKTYAVDFAGDGLLKFAITAPVEQVAPGARALIENSGTLAAEGGTVLLTAAAAKGVIENVINTSGIIEATSVAAVNGQIVLSGSGGGTRVSGTLDASGKGAGETGGQVAVLGDSVTLAPGARIDVSGDAGGGTALIGGNFHGAGPQQNAQATSVAQGATIDADAITSGNGGGVAVWSDGATSVAGTITARGGATGGKGGSVETSGKQQLFITGTVDTRAPLGHVGTWLSDPTNYTICISGCNETGAHVASTVAASERVIDTSGNITVSDAISYSSSNQLSLLAGGNITVSATIQNSGSGNVNLVAGWNGSAGLNIGGTSFNAATLLGIANSYGQNNGSVTIGDGTQGSGIAVGSAGGQTNIAANNLTLTGSNNSNGAFAQVGYAGGDASGAITVTLSNDLTLTGGSGDSGGAYAQIGHGAADGTSSASVAGDITVQVAGLTTLAPFSTSSGQARIGNASQGTPLGNVTLTSGTISSSNQALGDSLGDDIPGGNVTIDVTGAGAMMSIGDNTTHEYLSPFAITLKAPAGTINFNGTVINDENGSITITAANITAQGSITTASGAVTINGRMVLDSDFSIDTTTFGDSAGANVAFNGTIDDSSGNAGTAGLTVAAGSGAVTFGGALGGTVPIAALTATASTINLNGNITTDLSPVMFTGPVVLMSDVTIDTTANGTQTNGKSITFSDIVGGVSFEGQGLTLKAGTTGDIDFQSDVGFPGDGARLKSLTIVGANLVSSEGANGISAGSFTETGGQSDLDITGQITTGFGTMAINPPIVNGGPISISTAGNVTIGSGLPLVTSNGVYLPSLYSGGADAGSVSNSFGLGVGTTTGNAGAITVTAGGTLTLYNGATARGGRTDRAGVNGGNAAAISLTSTGGDVAIADTSWNDRGVYLDAFGGDFDRLLRRRQWRQRRGHHRLGAEHHGRKDRLRRRRHHQRIGIRRPGRGHLAHRERRHALSLWHRRCAPRRFAGVARRRCRRDRARPVRPAHEHRDRHDHRCRRQYHGDGRGNPTRHQHPRRQSGLDGIG